MSELLYYLFNDLLWPSNEAPDTRLRAIFHQLVDYWVVHVIALIVVNTKVRMDWTFCAKLMLGPFSGYVGVDQPNQF